MRLNARAVERLAAVGIPATRPPEALTRIRIGGRGTERTVILRLVPNRERLLLITRAGFVGWLDDKTNKGSSGYLWVRVEVGEPVAELIVLSFRHQPRFALGAELEPDIRIADQQWVGPGTSGPGGDWKARFAAESLQRTLATGFFIRAGGRDPRDEPLPGAFCEVVATDRAEAALPAGIVRASVTAAMPERVPVDKTFDLVVTINGPDVEPGSDAVIVTGEKDVPVTVEVLRIQNVKLIRAEDPLIPLIPSGADGISWTFALSAFGPGPVLVEVRITQKLTLLAVFRLNAVAEAGVERLVENAARVELDAGLYPQNWQLQITQGGFDTDPEKTALSFQLRSDHGVVQGRTEFARGPQLLAFYANLLGLWNQHASIKDHALRSQRWAEALAIHGGTLFDNLFPAAIRAELWRQRATLGDIYLSTNETEIPWEITRVHAPQNEPGAEPQEEQDSPFFLGARGVFRWLTGTPKVTAVQIEPPNVLVLAPTSGLHNVAVEVGFLCTQYHAQVIDPADTATLNRILSGSRFSLFHFAGHGGIDVAVPPVQHLLLNAGEQFTVAQLQMTLPFSPVEPGRAAGAVIVLNACQTGVVASPTSGFGSAFLAAGAGVFIGTLWSIEDEPAGDYSIELYKSLLAEPRVLLSAAVRRARERARESYDPSWLGYAVYADPNTVVTVVRP
ncbi:CHAT domain-containing protein [Arthrobacter sp. HLT1-20]